MILHQVNKLFVGRSAVVKQFMRMSSCEPAPVRDNPYNGEPKYSPGVLFPMESRKLIKISGEDTSAFLQGLITNDMRHFDEGAKSIYAMFLNNKGRVLYDSLIHQWEGKDSFMIECDKKLLELMERHLKLFKLKRKIKIENMSSLYKLWVVIGPPNYFPDLPVDPSSSINVYKDPRLPDLGYRILTHDNYKADQLKEIIGADFEIHNDESGYRYLRYKLGVSEGYEDLLPGTRFPLEANCDYLHGVSFHKGCYIGQELLARVYFTGVIRKRIMPIKFASADTEHLTKDTLILANNESKVVLGKVTGCLHDHGLGLLKLKEALEVKTLLIGKNKGSAVRPHWWPIEAPKEIKDRIKENTSEQVQEPGQTA